MNRIYALDTMLDLEAIEATKNEERTLLWLGPSKEDFGENHNILLRGSPEAYMLQSNQPNL
jgi:hypothetical protein